MRSTFLRLKNTVQRTGWKIAKAVSPQAYRLAKHQFRWQGELLEYVVRSYNATWTNERAVELAIARHWIKPKGVHTLEVGNVLGHYGLMEGHTVVDLYEKGRGVRNEDILKHAPLAPYDQIISISTLEHIGLPDHEEKAVAALNAMVAMLSERGRMLVTWPVGVNRTLDRLVAGNEKGPLKSVTALVRTHAMNRWTQQVLPRALAHRYNERFPKGNSVIVGTIGD